MSIAEKIATIAANEQRVYDAGYEKGKADGGGGGGYTDGDLDASYNEGYDDGRQAEYDAFWDDFQKNGKRTEYHNAFGIAWSSKTFRPKYNIVATGAYSMFHNFCYGQGVSLKQMLADCNVTLTFLNAYNIGNLFNSAGITELGEIDLSTTRNNSAYIFNECILLKTIDRLVLPVGQTTFSGWFTNCKALENITIEGEIIADISFQWSTLLTRASIESIVNHLSDTATGKTLTLSKTAVDEAFKFELWTPEGELIEVSYGSDANNPYFPNLRDSKPNWTITLV